MEQTNLFTENKEAEAWLEVMRAINDARKNGYKPTHIEYVNDQIDCDLFEQKTVGTTLIISFYRWNLKED